MKINPHKSEILTVKTKQTVEVTRDGQNVSVVSDLKHLEITRRIKNTVDTDERLQTAKKPYMLFSDQASTLAIECLQLSRTRCGKLSQCLESCMALRSSTFRNLTSWHSSSIKERSSNIYQRDLDSSHMYLFRSRACRTVYWKEVSVSISEYCKIARISWI